MRVAVRLRHVLCAATGRDIKDRFERLMDAAANLIAEQRARLLAIADRCPARETLKRGSQAFLCFAVRATRRSTRPASRWGPT